MPTDGCPYEDTFEMSGACTPRYASQECLSFREYNMKTDVYSFAVVLWEMLTGETPYSNIKNREHLRQVVDEQDGRLEIEVEWPKRVQNM